MNISFMMGDPDKQTGKCDGYVKLEMDDGTIFVYPLTYPINHGAFPGNCCAFYDGKLMCPHYLLGVPHTKYGNGYGTSYIGEKSPIYEVLKLSSPRKFNFEWLKYFSFYAHIVLMEANHTTRNMMVVTDNTNKDSLGGWNYQNMLEFFTEIPTEDYETVYNRNSGANIFSGVLNLRLLAVYEKILREKLEMFGLKDISFTYNFSKWSYKDSIEEYILTNHSCSSAEELVAFRKR